LANLSIRFQQKIPELLNSARKAPKWHSTST
jgi:hypothetical protein